MRILLFLILCQLFLHQTATAQVSVVNMKGTVVPLDTSKWNLSGANIINKNTGNVGVGNPSPNYKLDVTGKFRVSDSLVTNSARVISLSSGTTSDSFVMADPSTGILKRLSISNIVKANNGLTKNALDTIQLGGSLNNATTITTSATNTLALAGLQSGSASDSIVTIDATSNILKRIERKKATVIKTTTTQATTGTGLININILEFSAIAGKNYRVRLWLVYNSSATTNGIRLGPNTFSGGNIWYSTTVNISTTAAQQLGGFNTNTELVTSGCRVATNNVALIEIDIECTTTSTLSFRFGAELTAGTITIQPNSRLEYEITN